MYHQGPTESNIDTPNPPVHPRLVISPEEVNKSHICVTCPLWIEVEIFIYWTVLIYIQTIPSPSHNDNMILLGEVFTKLPNILNNVYNRTMWFENTTNLKCGALVFLEHLSHSPPITASKQYYLSFFFLSFFLSNFPTFVLTTFSFCFSKPGLYWTASSVSVSSILNLCLSWSWGGSWTENLQTPAFELFWFDPVISISLPNNINAANYSF